MGGLMSERGAREGYQKASSPVQKFFRKLGLDVFHHRKSHVYCPERLVVKAMKMMDTDEIPGFGELSRMVLGQERTRLDQGKLYMLYQGLWNVSRSGVSRGNMAEVGVYKGGGTYFMASASARLFERQPTIYAFDTFEGHAEVDISPQLDGPHKPGKFSDTSFEEVAAYLAPFPNVVVHKGRFQDRMDVISGETFCFVHLDVDIYSVTRDCLAFFEDRLVDKGIILVDDYGIKTCQGAKEAVDLFLDDRKHFIKFHLETGQCLLIKTRDIAA
jgi:O-methyltransferase